MRPARLPAAIYRNPELLMNQRELASTLLAVLGVFIVASRSPEFLPHALVLKQGGAVAGNDAIPEAARAVSMAALVAVAVAVGIGAALIWLREPIARRLFPAQSGPLRAPDFQAVAFSVLGAYLVVSSLRYIYMPGGLRWAGVLQIVLGAALFIGARGLARVWAGLRTAYQ
jgi:hypothetical protein